MDAFGDRQNEMIVVMTSSQVGKTEIILNVVGYHIHQDPAPILLLQPTLEMAEAFSKDRVQPMIRDTPALDARVDQSKSRDSGNTILHKNFPGGRLSMTGANSPASLASRPIRIVLFDEVDRFPKSAGNTGEGDPVELASRRTERFWNRRKAMFSTPTLEGQSRIATAYEESDQRKFYVPCPKCGQHQVLVWAQVKWFNRDPNTAHYKCIACEDVWDDSTRWKAVARGQWRATAVFNGTAGFHVWEAYAPNSELRKIVREYLIVKDYAERLKTWTNTTLGETFKERGEAPEHRRLYDRREPWKMGTVPNGGLFLTAGIDVQADRVEALVVAWGRGRENWTIDRVVFDSSRTTEESVWKDLTEFLGRTYQHESGLTLHLARVAIDSGFNTQQVYDWARLQGSRVIVVKGYDSGAAVLGTPRAIDFNSKGQKKKRSVRVWPVNVSMLKEELYGALRLERPTDEQLTAGEPYPAGYCHFPGFDEEFFKQLTAEELVVRSVKGYRRSEWQKVRDRNEALDCHNYARAAASHVGIDRFTERDWRTLEASFKVEEPIVAEVKPAEVVQVAQMFPEQVAPPPVPTVQGGQRIVQPGNSNQPKPYQPVRSNWMNRG